MATKKEYLNKYARYAPRGSAVSVIKVYESRRKPQKSASRERLTFSQAVFRRAKRSMSIREDKKIKAQEKMRKYQEAKIKAYPKPTIFESNKHLPLPFLQAEDRRREAEERQRISSYALPISPHIKEFSNMPDKQTIARFEQRQRAIRAQNMSVPITQEINPEAEYVESPSVQQMPRREVKEKLRELKGSVKEYAKRKSIPLKEIRAIVPASITEKYRRVIARESRAKVLKRERGARMIMKAIGAAPGASTGYGAGRPRGSFDPRYSKYGGVYGYRKAMQQRKILYAQYQQQQQQRFAQKGFTPAQVQQLQQQQVIQEVQQPRQVPQQQFQTSRVSPPDNQQFARPAPTNAADDELAFRQFQIQQQVSPNTQRILDSIRRIQNKGKIDNMEQQRRHFERNLVGRSMNMMKSHENMIDTTIDFSGVKDDNILKAPSVFKENPENNILRSRGRPNILQTREAGNSLWF